MRSSATSARLSRLVRVKLLQDLRIEEERFDLALGFGTRQWFGRSSTKHQRRQALKKINRQQIFENLMDGVDKRWETISLGALNAVIFKEGTQYFIQESGKAKKRIREPRVRAELHAEAARREDQQSGFEGEV